MRIHYLADLHIEYMVDRHGRYSVDDLEMLEKIRNTDSDVLILGGDSYYKGRTIKHAVDLANGRTVVVVSGNHEYYTGSYLHGLDKMRRHAARAENVHFLENESVEIGGVIFLGCTLWTNLGFFEQGPYRGLYKRTEVLSDLSEGLNDYRLIKWRSGRPLQPSDTQQIHVDSVVWLCNQFHLHRGKQIVVVSHHAPSIKSVNESFHQDILSAGYASHLDDLVEESGATLWIHGHTHSRLDYMIGGTRILSNCRGYDAESAERINFDPEAIVEI